MARLRRAPGPSGHSRTLAVGVGQNTESCAGQLGGRRAVGDWGRRATRRRRAAAWARCLSASGARRRPLSPRPSPARQTYRHARSPTALARAAQAILPRARHSVAVQRSSARALRPAVSASLATQPGYLCLMILPGKRTGTRQEDGALSRRTAA